MRLLARQLPPEPAWVLSTARPNLWRAPGFPPKAPLRGEVAGESDPRVIRVEVVDEVDHQAHGYDAENEIVVVQFDDMAPETFCMYTCP